MSQEQHDRFKSWVKSLVRDPVAGPQDKRMSQRELGNRTGVSQGQISKIVLDAWIPLSSARQMIETFGDDPANVLDGMPRAKVRYKGRVLDPMRADVLEALSSCWDKAFLDYISHLRPPPGSAGWTATQWLDHALKLRELYESGALAIDRPPDSTLKRAGRH